MKRQVVMSPLLIFVYFFPRSPVEFRVLDGASMSVMNLPQPIEARYLRLNLVNFTSNQF